MVKCGYWEGITDGVFILTLNEQQHIPNPESKNKLK